MTDEWQPVKSADRTLEILERLAAHPGRSLVELARELDIPKSSLHGILRTMARRGWVETDPTGTRFGLGMRALQVGAAYLEADDAVGMLSVVLDRLAAELGETVHLGRLDGANVVYMAKRESIHPLRLYSAIGRHLPAHATALGKALLAGLPPATVDALLPRPLPALTAHTITDPAALRTELDVIAGQGWSMDRQENTEGIVCFAMAVPLRAPATDAISISIPAARVTGSTQEKVLDALRRALAGVRAARALLS